MNNKQQLTHIFSEVQMNTQVLQTVVEFAKINRPKFVSFQYENEYEKAQVTLLVGVNLNSVYERDLRALKSAQSMETDPIRKQAIDELVASVENSLSKGIGNNDDYTKKNVYTAIGNNVKQHVENGNLYVSGFVIRKNVIEVKAQRKKVNSSDKTIAKNSLRKRYTRMANFREYILDVAHMGTVAINKNRIVIAPPSPTLA